MADEIQNRPTHVLSIGPSLDFDGNRWPDRPVYTGLLAFVFNNGRWSGAVKIVTSCLLHYLLSISVVVVRFRPEILRIDILDHFGSFSSFLFGLSMLTPCKQIFIKMGIFPVNVVNVTNLNSEGNCK